MHTLETQERQPEQAEYTRKFEGDEVETIEYALQMIESLEMNEADKQVLKNGIELLLQEPDEPGSLEISDPLIKRQLESEYLIVDRLRDHSLAALKVVENLHKKGLTHTQLVQNTAEFLVLYRNKLNTYEQLLEADNTDVHAAEVGSKEEVIYQLLQFENLNQTQWNTILIDLQEPIREPTKAELAKFDDSYRSFIDLRKHDAIEARKAAVTMLYGYALMAQLGRPVEISTNERRIILESLHVYLQHKDQYEADLENYRQSNILNTVAATVASEGAEEVFEEFGERFDSLKIRDIKLLSAANTARAEMMANGVRNPPSVGEIFKRIGGRGVNVLRQTARVVSPRHAASLIVFMLYMQGAEDKTRALLSYSTFMAGSKGLDKVGTLLSKTPGLRNLSVRLAKIKAPVALKFAIIIAAGIGFGDEIDGAISSLERRADPTMWDAAGNVVGILSAPVDVYTQLGGSALIDPRRDQLDYLTFEAGVVQNTSWTTANARHRITQWDQVVEAYASSEQNPTLRELIQLESIHNGPGGYDGWVSRQALDFYQMFSNVEALENEINTEVRELGVHTPALSLVSLLHDQEQATGDRNVRYEMVYNQHIYTAFYNNVNARKTELTTELEHESNQARKAELQEAIKRLDALLEKYKYYEHFIKKTDKRRSDYVRLGIFSTDWISKEPHEKLPPIVMRGLYSTLDLEGRRREVLSGYEDSTDLAELIRHDGPPAVTLDPMGFVSYFVASNATWDDRIFDERYVNAAKEFTEQIGREINTGGREDVFKKLFDELSAHPDRAANGREVMSQIAAAYADYYFEGNIRDGSRFLEGKTDRHGRPRYFDRLFILQNNRIGQTGFETSHDLLSQIEDTNQPVILCSQMVGSTEITSIIQFTYDYEQKSWNVSTKTTGYVPFYESSVMYSRPILVNQSARATVEESFATWRIRHPKLAMQIAPELIEYIEEQERISAEIKQRRIELEQQREAEKPENIRKVERLNAERATALEAARAGNEPQFIPPEWSFSEVTLIPHPVLGGNKEEFAAAYNGYNFSFMVPPLNEGPSWNASHGDWKKSLNESDYFKSTLTDKDGKSIDWKTSVWGLKHNDVYDAESRRVITHILTTPVDISNHPSANDPNFVEHIREYEIQRLLDATSFDWSGSWSGTRVQAYFYQGLIDHYKNMRNGRSAFLTELLEFLQTSDPITYNQCRSFLRKLHR